MMPGGLQLDDIKELWPTKDEWFGHLNKLTEMSLVQKKEEESIISSKKYVSYSLLPFMNHYSEIINKQRFDFPKMHKQTCIFFCKMVQTIFEKIDIEKERDHQQSIRGKLVMYETNIWACLNRIKEMKE